MKHRHYNLTISMLSFVLFFLAAVTMFLSAKEVYLVNSRVQEQRRIEENRRRCEIESQALLTASDYLTSEVWHFIATQRLEHMDNYWREVYETRERERALSALRSLSLTDQEEALIEDAKQTSDELVSGEAWAMRLIVDSMGVDRNILPPDLIAVSLTPQEEAMSPEQKRQAALDYIFGEDYTSSKMKIIGDINESREILRERKNRELSEAVEATQAALGMSQFYNGLMLVYLLLSVVLFYLLATRPFHKYAKAMRKMGGGEFAPLSPSGSKDTREFADAYNEIYAEWQEQKGRLEEERFRFLVALENTQTVVYEYLPDTDTYMAYGTLKEGCAKTNGVLTERVYRNFLSERVLEIAGEEGAKSIRRLAERGEGRLELPILFDGVKIWGRLTANAVRDEDDHLLKIIGKIANIQSEKEKEFALEAVRSRDLLTGVYNKEAGLRLVQSYMEQKSPEEICGIMILDMDAFDQINQTEGNVFADAVLQDVADILRAYTDADDILIRLGGDEFMMFIKNCPKSRATVLGPKIAEAIRSLTPGEHSDIQISASIGMCVTEVVDEYSGLYRCAESTLKYVKSNGKGRAACYLDTSNELGVLLTQMYPDKHPFNAINRPTNMAEDMVSFALDLLGKAKNLDDAIYLLLARVGRQYRFDRISIMELDREYLNCHFIYEWAKNPVDNQNGKIIYINKEELKGLSAAYDSDGLCDHYVLNGAYTLKSILHAAVWNRGNYDGAMSFEIREENHRWSEEERRLLSELVKIISSFILKARADAVSQAKTDFLSRMSHEIRTPMNAITGMTVIAKHALDNPDKIRDCLNKIESASSYLLSLINDILDMSRIESGKVELAMEPVDVAEQMADLSVLVRPQMEEKGLNFIILNGYDGARKLMADSLHLNQVIVNLLGNAVKFTDKGGSVTLRLEVTGRSEKGVQLRFSVIDTGIGISEEAQRRIFNSFEQASTNIAASYGGTGLGLAISSRLVQLMGGSLEVKSRQGEGSEFYFTLEFAYAPGAELGQALPAEFIEPGERYDPQGKRLLLAEDNELNREIAVEILEMNGFSVESAENGRVAAELFEKNPPGHYDAILMDIRMPVMNGFDATRRIRTMGKSDSRTVPIIAMTANAFDEDMRQSIESGMNGHLSKPIEVDKLLFTLRRCIFTAEDKMK